MRGPTDGTLLGQVIEGDRSGYLRLVDRYAPLLVALVQHRLGSDSPAAESIVAETFRDAFLELRRLRNPENFFRRLIELAREKAAQKTTPPAPAERLALAAQEDEEWILAQIVRWKYLDGESYEQIGKRLGVPAQRVDQWIQRGRIRSRWSHLVAETSR